MQKEDALQVGYYWAQVSGCESAEVVYYDGAQFYSARLRDIVPSGNLEYVRRPKIHPSRWTWKQNEERSPEIVRRIFEGESTVKISKDLNITVPRVRQLFFKRVRERYPFVMDELQEQYGEQKLMFWARMNRSRLGYKADEVIK